MKDSQNVSLQVEVKVQDNMASTTAAAPSFKTLSPIAEMGSHTLTNGDSKANEHEAKTEADLLLQSEEENGDDAADQPETHSTNDISSETEDEILNKFDTDTLEKEVLLEDKLLNDIDEIENEMIKINGDEQHLETGTTQRNGDVQEVADPAEHAPVVVECVTLEPILNDSVDADSNADAHLDANVNVDANVDVNTDADANTDMHVNTDADADTAMDVNTDADASTDVDANTDANAEADPIIQNGHADSDQEQKDKLLDNDEQVLSTDDVEHVLIHNEEQTDPFADIIIETVNGDAEDEISPCSSDVEPKIQIDKPLEEFVVITEVQTVLSPSESEEESIRLDNHVEDMETEDKTKEQQDAEFLKDQIMDTEDLLQIIEEKPSPPNELETETDPEPEPEQYEDIHEHDQDDTEVDEFEGETITTEDGTIVKEEVELKDGEIDPVSDEVIPFISNENSSEDKDDMLIIDEKLSDDDEKCAVDGGAMLTRQSSLEEEKVEEAMDVEDTETATLQEDSESKTSKRMLSESDTENETKKLKTDDAIPDSKKTGIDAAAWALIYKNRHINTFKEFLCNKHIEKLTHADLEEFCLQKMCEAIYHRSEIGELRHKLGIQEQMVEMWRKEVMSLMKQARDLEIVNKRLLHEVRLKANNDKPLIPVKITRSVGLQVRCDSAMNINPPKRRAPPPRAAPNHIVQTLAPKPSANKSSTTPGPAGKPAATTSNTNKPATKVIPSKSNSLLTQALVNSSSNMSKSPIKTIAGTSLRVVPGKQPSGKATPPKATTPVTLSAVSSTDKAFIDLTDEDERKPSPVSTSQTAVTNVRIVKTTATNGVSSTVSTSPRVMYLYNNQLHQGLLTPDPAKPGAQKLMLKLNSNMMSPTNGVVATVPNNVLPVTASTPIRSGQVRFTPSANAARNTPAKTSFRHPAPLPAPPASQLNIAARKPIPPRPLLNIRRSSGGIVLSWKMPYNLDGFEAIASYQLYAYQETCSVPSSEMWRKVGDVKALALPMACTLTQFADGNKYYFAVRAVDVHKRTGQFSEPEQILL